MEETAPGQEIGGFPYIPPQISNDLGAAAEDSSPVLQAALRHALEQDEFRLAYQPIVDLRNHRTIGAEALIRWPRTLIGPDIFIPVAERVGLIRDITRQVCQLAASDRITQRIPGSIRLSINLSAADAETMETASLLSNLSRELGSPAALSVELTERCLLTPERCSPVIQAIRAQGIQVHLDDFGTGYANLQSLVELSLDGIKIDHRLTRRVDGSRTAREIVRHLGRLAGALGLSVTAEGVETEAQARWLSVLGIRRAQGWLFGRPRFIEDYPAHTVPDAGPRAGHKVSGQHG
ncbi:EAL domain-containing protein [Castellaniella sp. WN]